MSHTLRTAEPTSPLVTRDILRLALQEFRSDLHRALWIVGAAIVAAAGGIAAAVAVIVATAR